MVSRLHVGTCLLPTKSINYLYVKTFELLPSPSPQAPEHSMGLGEGQGRAPGALGKVKILAESAG